MHRAANAHSHTLMSCTGAGDELLQGNKQKKARLVQSLPYVSMSAYGHILAICMNMSLLSTEEVLPESFPSGYRSMVNKAMSWKSTRLPSRQGNKQFGTVMINGLLHTKVEVEVCPGCMIQHTAHNSCNIA